MSDQLTQKRTSISDKLLLFRPKCSTTTTGLGSGNRETKELTSPKPEAPDLLL